MPLTVIPDLGNASGGIVTGFVCSKTASFDAVFCVPGLLWRFTPLRGGNEMTRQSQKVYVEGSREDIRVPMREITLSGSAGVNGELETENPPVRVYDASGPYTDAHMCTDIREGLPRSAGTGYWKAAMSRNTRAGSLNRRITDCGTRNRIFPQRFFRD